MSTQYVAELSSMSAEFKAWLEQYENLSEEDYCKLSLDDRVKLANEFSYDCIMEME